MTYRPRRGLLWLALGLPIFAALRIGAEMIDDSPNYTSAAIWAVGMAITFSLLVTFTKVLGD